MPHRGDKRTVQMPLNIVKKKLISSFLMKAYLGQLTKSQVSYISQYCSTADRSFCGSHLTWYCCEMQITRPSNTPRKTNYWRTVWKYGPGMPGGGGGGGHHWELTALRRIKKKKNILIYVSYPLGHAQTALLFSVQAFISIFPIPMQSWQFLHDPLVFLSL